MKNRTIFSKTDFRGRKSLRLKDRDYARNSSYFVTICARRRLCIFGKITNEEMHLNKIGQIVKVCWQQLPVRHANVKLDEFTVMPNHFHGIIVIKPSFEKTMTLGQIIGGFKSLSAVRCIRESKLGNLPSLGQSIWQRNYHERIIHDENELMAYRRYIKNNPKTWKQDVLSPDERQFE